MQSQSFPSGGIISLQFKKNKGKIGISGKFILLDLHERDYEINTYSTRESLSRPLGCERGCYHVDGYGAVFKAHPQHETR